MEIHQVHRFSADLKKFDSLLTDLDTACALGDLEYVLKLLQYTVPTPPMTFDAQRNEGPITEETMQEKFGKHLDTFNGKVSKSAGEKKTGLQSN